MDRNRCEITNREASYIVNGRGGQEYNRGMSPGQVLLLGTEVYEVM